MNPKPSFIEEGKVFIIAEIGGNHEGNFEYAKKLLLDASKTGADAVKFQIYRGDKIVSKVEGEDRNKHFKKFELPDERFMKLAKLAEENNIMFMASVWDKEALETFDPFIKIHKVGSGDMTNYPLLKALAETNKPLIISTAMSTLEEIRDMVAFIDKANPNLIKENKLVLLHCVATYGNPKDEYANLLSIKKMQDEFPDIPIGYSDHTMGILACEIAISMGACVIEKHFTDDKTREFRDHHISIDLNEMKELVETAKDKKDINESDKKNKLLLGKCEKKPIEAIETPERIAEFRRAVYPNKDLATGTELTEENLTTLRPNKGIDARKFYDILGKKLNKDKKAFENIDEDDYI